MKERILHTLRNTVNQPISGQSLSELLGCSRMAVWKHIEKLREQGYRIEALSRKGYRLITEIDSIHPKDWQKSLTTEYIGQNTQYFTTVDSTQSIAHQWAREGAIHGTCIIADQQTSGKGRLGRTWFSPVGVGLWASFILRPALPIDAMSQITLVMAVAVARTLSNFGYNPEIKWPNDILLEGKKVCGILTELQGDFDQVRYLIVGIGLNIDQREEEFSPEIREIATSLYLVKPEGRPKRAEVYFELCKQIEELYQLYITTGFAPIKILWETYAMQNGRRIKVTTLKNTYMAKLIGINEQGVLLVEDEAGDLHHIHSADIEIYTDER